MKNCENGCCSFSDKIEDKEIYCASMNPETTNEEYQKRQDLIDNIIFMLPYFEKISSNIYMKNGQPFYITNPSSGTKPGDIVGNITKKGYRRCGVTINGKVKRLMLHRIIWFKENGVIPHNQIDHIDHDKDNNEISNLRLATNGQNQLNTPKRKGLSSLYKGVHLHSKEGKFRAHINKNKVRYYLGSFDLEDNAAYAYDQALVDLDLLEYGILNFPHNEVTYIKDKGLLDYKTKDLSCY